MTNKIFDSLILFYIHVHVSVQEIFVMVSFAYLYDKTEEPSVCFLVRQILVPHWYN